MSAPGTAPGSDAEAVYGWLARAQTATLCTLLADARAPGAPFGTAVPYIVDDGIDTSGAPVVVISDLAVHTKNLLADPRASLLVMEPGLDDPQAGWRVTLVGTMRKVDGDRASALLAAFRARFPRSSGGSELPGFAPWILDVTTTRFIAGFGKMGWL